MQAVLLTLQKWLSLCTWTLQGILCHKNICHSIMLRLFRPDRHIPLHSGPPAAYPAGSRQQLYTVPPTYQPHFSNTRTHTCGELLEGFGQPSPPPLQPGHDAALFNPLLASRNLANLDDQELQQHLGQRGGRPRQQQQQQRRRRQPDVILNGNNLCFCASVFHLLERIEVVWIV